MRTIIKYLISSQHALCIFPVYTVHKKLKELYSEFDPAFTFNDACSGSHKENSVQPLKKPTQVPLMASPIIITDFAALLWSLGLIDGL
jgi:hypothetical protein